MYVCVYVYAYVYVYIYIYIHNYKYTHMYGDALPEKPTELPPGRSLVPRTGSNIMCCTVYSVQCIQCIVYSVLYMCCTIHNIHLPIALSSR